MNLLENGIEVNTNHVFEFVFEDSGFMDFIQFTYQDRLGVCQELSVQIVCYDIGQVLDNLDREGSARGGDSTHAWVKDVDGDPLTDCQPVYKTRNVVALTIALNPY